jgi:hypothetical protein
MFLQEIILAIIILAYVAFAVALFIRIGAVVSARWSSHKPPERQQTGAKILPFPTAKPSQECPLPYSRERVYSASDH